MTGLCQIDGFKAVRIENELVSAIFLPEIGGKMVELTSRKTGRQFLLRPQTNTGRYRQPDYGGDFAAYDTSGFDECFPTVSSSRYLSLSEPDKTSDMWFPDHGELWSRPWRYELHDDELVATVQGVRADYRFERRVRLDRNAVVLEYTLVNQSAASFTYLWSAHPLLQVSPATRIILPRNVDHVLLNWASERSIGKFGDVLPWPHLSGGSTGRNYADVQDRAFGRAVKCFTDALEAGHAIVHHRDTDDALLFTFDVRENPYLGLWLCYGGWPDDGREKHLTVAVEPCSGRPDSLEEAVRRNECGEIAPGATKKWWLKMSVWTGVPDVG